MSGGGGAGGGGGGGERVALMWGYLPGATPQRAPLLSPVPVAMPDPADVSGGGCGFAMAISGSGRLFTWGSADDLGQSFVTAGKHMETPEPFPLPSEAAIVQAAAGWAHCAAVTDCGDVYTWGWKECVPTGTAIAEGSTLEKDEHQSGFLSDQVSPIPHATRTNGGMVSSSGEESTKRRKISSAKQGPETSTSNDETLSALPCLVSINAGVRITAVAAGGRHTLALSDFGQVWGWGYGGEGQLGLGSRIRVISSPQPVPCIESVAYVQDRPPTAPGGNRSSDVQLHNPYGTCIKAIACGGRHSAVITDAGALLTFGWGLYGQCGHGSTDDELIPACVSSLLGVKMQGIAAGLWHTVCTSEEGDVYAFGGNQFGQLGTGSDQAETLPKLLETPCLENKNAKIVSCGARHSAIVTEDREVFCWGWNKYGQLGLGDTIDRSTPTHVSINVLRPSNVACGWWHTLVLAEPPG